MSDKVLTQDVEYWGASLKIFFFLESLEQEKIISHVRDTLGLRSEIFLGNAVILKEQGLFFILSDSIPGKLSSFYELEEGLIPPITQQNSKKVQIAYTKF